MYVEINGMCKIGYLHVNFNQVTYKGSFGADAVIVVWDDLIKQP